MSNATTGVPTANDFRGHDPEGLVAGRHRHYRCGRQQPPLRLAGDPPREGDPICQAVPLGKLTHLIKVGPVAGDGQPMRVVRSEARVRVNQEVKALVCHVEAPEEDDP